MIKINGGRIQEENQGNKNLEGQIIRATNQNNQGQNQEETHLKIRTSEQPEMSVPLISEEIKNPINVEGGHSKKMMIKTNIYTVFIVFSALFIQACEQARKFEFFETIDGESWHVNDTISAEYRIEDTLNVYNFYLNIRNNNNYPYSNLYVFATTTFPNGRTRIDTVECVLAYPDGTWFGNGFGGVFDNRVLYKQRKRFPLVGDYKIELVHGMRTETLNGLLDVGYRIESVKTK